MSEKDYGFVVVHVPHSSIYIPNEYMKDYIVSKKTLDKEILRMTDSFCDELYDPFGFEKRVVAEISRLVCDVERFRDDKDEYNARYGHGLMYTKTSLGRLMRENDETVRTKILEEIYDPHHKKLEEAVDTALDRYGFCLIIDGHSFNSKKIVKFDNIFSFPDFDIGTDSFHTPSFLIEGICDEVKRKGYTSRLNSPYSGAITPLKHYGKNSNVVSIMIETNRKLYMNEKKRSKNEDFFKIRKVIHSLMYKATDLVWEHFRGQDG